MVGIPPLPIFIHKLVKERWSTSLYFLSIVFQSCYIAVDLRHADWQYFRWKIVLFCRILLHFIFRLQRRRTKTFLCNLNYRVLILFNMWDSWNLVACKLVSCPRLVFNSLVKCSRLTIMCVPFQIFAKFLLKGFTDCNYEGIWTSFHVDDPW